MIALVRYQLAALGHSQRYLPPTLLFLGLLAVLYSNNTGPALPGFAVTSGALLVVSGWLTVALVDVEDPVQRLVTRSRAGSVHRTLAGLVLAVSSCCAVLAVVAVAWAQLSHGFGYSLGALGIGVVVHLVCAAAGIAVGLPCSRLLVRRIGYSVILACLSFGAVLLAEWIPLVHPMLAALSSGRITPGLLVGSACAAVAALVVSSVLVGVRSARRD